MGTEKQNKHVLRLHPSVIAWLISYFVLVFGALIVIAFRRDDFSVLDRMLSSVLFSIGVIVIPSYGAWRATRSNKVGNIVCVAMVFLLYSCVGFGASLAFKSKKKADDLTAAYSELDTVLDEHYEDDLTVRWQSGEDVSSEAIQRLNDFSDAADRIAAIGGEDDQAIAVLATVMQSIEPSLTAYSDSAKTYNDAGGVDVSTLNSLEDFVIRQTMLDIFIDASRHFSEAYMQLEPMIRRDLQAKGFTQDRIEYFVTQWRLGARPDMAEKLRELEILYLQEDKRMLIFFAARLGTWSVDQDGFVEFENENDNTPFDILWQASDTAVENFSAYQNEMARIIRENRNR